MAPLLQYEGLLVNVIEEAAQVGIYFKLSEMAFKIADLIDDTDAQDKWALLPPSPAATWRAGPPGTPTAAS